MHSPQRGGHDKHSTASCPPPRWVGEIGDVLGFDKDPRGICRATYRMANLRGFSDRTGNRKKQSRKQTAAPRLHAMKMSIRSHRLTVKGIYD